MDIGGIIPLVLFVLWIVSNVNKKKKPLPGKNFSESSEEEEEPGEAVERFFRQLSGEKESLEEKLKPPPFRPLPEKEVFTAPEPDHVTPLPVKEVFPQKVSEQEAPPVAPREKDKKIPFYLQEDIEGLSELKELKEMEEMTQETTRAKEIPSPLVGEINLNVARRGIILSEILGPPRADRPL